MNRARLAGPALLVLVLAFPAMGGGETVAVRVDSFLKPLVERELISGSVLIGRGDRIVLARGYGLADREHGVPNRPDTKFRLGSVTKQFTAMGVLILAEKGLLSLDDPLSKFLPEFHDAERITLHHLLTHTSGLPNYNRMKDYDDQLIRPLTIDEVIAWFGIESLLFEPGERFSYSNSGYVLLAKVIETASEKSYEDFLRENIFEPLEMWDTGMDVPTRILANRARGYGKFDGEIYAVPYRDLPFTSGAGSLLSTVLDLHKWDRALAAGRLISPELYRRMLTPVENDYGYGWFARTEFDRRVFEHSGAINGFLSQIRRYPDDDVVVVGLLNYESTFFPEVQKGLAAIALGVDPEPALMLDLPAPSAETLERYEGKYAIDEETAVELIVTAEGELEGRIGDSGADVALPQSDDRFFFPGLNLMVQVELSEDGAVSGLRLLQGAQRLSAKREQDTERSEGSRGAPGRYKRRDPSLRSG